MATFYIVENDFGGVVAVTMKLAAAREYVQPGDTLKAVEMPVNAESIRLLLACEGGYATKIRDIK